MHVVTAARLGDKPAGFSRLVVEWLSGLVVTAVFQAVFPPVNANLGNAVPVFNRGLARCVY